MSSRHLAEKPPHRTGECCGYAPSTKLKRFETVKALFSFGVSRDWIAKDPARAVKAPQGGAHPDASLSDGVVIKPERIRSGKLLLYTQTPV
jgi:site-specific recombinase XerD